METKVESVPQKNASRQWLLKPKRYEWANISGKYRRDLKDYVSLCPSCHKKMDLGLIEINI